MDWIFSTSQLQDTPSRRYHFSNAGQPMTLYTGMSIHITHTSMHPSNLLSTRDGVTADIETQFRRKTSWFIEELGKEMKW